jgi:hypothetical protein
MIEDDFLRRYEAWKKFVQQDPSCQFASADAPFIENAPFRAIVELGRAAIPAMVAHLFRDDCSHFLHHALRELTGHQFPPEDHAAARQLFGHLGNQAECAMWLGWWSKNRQSFLK